MYGDEHPAVLPFLHARQFHDAPYPRARRHRPYEADPVEAVIEDVLHPFRQPYGRGGKAREETLEIRSLNNARAARARKGKVADLGFKPVSITRVE